MRVEIKNLSEHNNTIKNKNKKQDVKPIYKEVVYIPPKIYRENIVDYFA